MKNLSSSSRPKKVIIVQRRMTHYRIPVFDAMRAALHNHGIELAIIYGDPTPQECLKNDTGVLSWGTHVPCRYYLGNRLCWQNPGRYLDNADLVIVTQEAKLLHNYFLQLLPTKFKLAYWGHGKNFHAHASSFVTESVKSWLLKKVDWWFAYTDQTSRVLLESGYSIDKITVLNNAIDTNSLRQEISSITLEERDQMRTSLNMGRGPVGIMLGSLYPEKRLGFLLEAFRVIRAKIPDFQLLIVGDGPDRDIVMKAIQDQNAGIYWAGARTGRDKAILLSLATVMLNPGMFGLTILDAFTARLPLLLTQYETSMPEAAYLIPGFNCLISPNTLADYAELVVDFLDNTVLQVKLASGCELSSNEYTVERMVNNFCEGIRDALV